MGQEYFKILQENGDYILQESGDKINLENVSLFTQSLSSSFDFTSTIEKTYNLPFGEAFSLSSVIKKSFIKTKSEIFTLIISFSCISIFIKRYIESLLLNVNVKKTINFSKLELIDLIDQTVRLITDTRRQINESISFLDSFSKSIIIKKIDNFENAESIIKNIELSKPEHIVFSESLIKTLRRYFEDSFTVTDSLRKNLNKKNNDLFSLIDVLLKKLNEKKISDDFLLSETKKIGLDIRDSFSDNISLLEAIKISTNILKTENISLAESLYNIFGKNVFDSLQISEIKTITSSYIRNMLESFSLVDLIDIETILSKSDNIYFNEELKKIIYLRKNETISIQEEIKKSLNLKKDEEVVLSSSLYSSFHLSLSNVFSIIENISKRNYISFFDSLQILDQIGTSSETIKSLSSLFTILDSLEHKTDKKILTIFSINDSLRRDTYLKKEEEAIFSDRFSKSIFIDIIDIESLIDSLVEDFDLSLSSALSFIESLEAAKVSPISEKTYLFSKKDKTSLFVDKDNTILPLKKNETRLLLKKDKSYLFTKNKKIYLYHKH